MTTELPARRSSWLPWILFLVSLVGAGLLFFFGVVPAAERAALSATEASRLKTDLDACAAAAAAERKQVQALLRDKGSLDRENTETKVKLEEALAEKERALAALEEARKDLSETLGTQIAAGDVLIKEVDGQLVVDVADKLLFDVGQATVTDSGQALLLQVAKSMKRLPALQVFQVGGHTDSQAVVSKELREQFPTNWELAAARATNVVRFLQERAAVPGRQLVAASFSQYRPASSNKTEAGRQQNRRIEIVLLQSKR